MLNKAEKTFIKNDQIQTVKLDEQTPQSFWPLYIFYYNVGDV